MTEPSERAKRRACEILGWKGRVYHTGSDIDLAIDCLAHHLDAEDKAARDALGFAGGYKVTHLADFAHRHILPESRPTVQDILRKRLWGSEIGYEETEQALRDAGLLKETDDDRN